MKRMRKILSFIIASVMSFTAGIAFTAENVSAAGISPFGGKNIIYDDGEIIIFKRDDGEIFGEVINERYDFKISYVILHNDGIVTPEWFGLSDEYVLEQTRYDDTTETYTVTVETKEEVDKLYEDAAELYEKGVIENAYKEFTYDYQCAQFVHKACITLNKSELNPNDIPGLEEIEYKRSETDENTYTLLFNEIIEFAKINAIKDEIEANENVASVTLGLCQCALDHAPCIVRTYIVEPEKIGTIKRYGDYLSYQTVDSNGDGFADYVKISDCDISAVSVEIPSRIDSLPVTVIGSEAFRDCTAMTDVMIPDTATEIEDSAFHSCTSLKSLTIPDGVKTIGESAFDFCTSLESATLSNSLENIGKYAFTNCSSLSSVIIPDNVTEIGDYAFYNCENLSEITIPESVMIIGRNAFDMTAWMNAAREADPLVVVNRILIDAKDAEGSVTVGGNVTQIGEAAFEENTNITAVRLPLSIRNIKESAFYACANLETVNIPPCVERIEKNAFAYCIGLTKMIIPRSVISVGQDAFAYCSGLKKTTIKNPNCNIYPSETTLGDNTSTGNIIFCERDSNLYNNIKKHIRNPLGYIIDTDSKINTVTFDDGAGLLYNGTDLKYTSDRYDFVMNYVIRHTDNIITPEFFGLSEESVIEVTDTNDASQTYSVKVETQQELDRLFEASKQLYKDDVILDAYKEFSYKYNTIRSFDANIILKDGVENFDPYSIPELKNYSFGQSENDPQVYCGNFLAKEYAAVSRLKNIILEDERVEDFIINNAEITNVYMTLRPETVYIHVSDEIEKETLKPIVKPTMFGDVTGDEKFDSSDIIKLAKYNANSHLYKLETDEALANADINFDGYVNSADMLALIECFIGAASLPNI